MMVGSVFVGSNNFKINIKCHRGIKSLFSVRIIVRLKMINYIEIFEEERIVSKKVKNVISDKNSKESCIQKATAIMLFIGPYDLVNTCWPNIKYMIKKKISRSNSIVDQITFPDIWTYPWKFLTSFSFIYYFFKIFFLSILISRKSC